MALYKILILNGRSTKTHTFSGKATIGVSGEDTISGVISGVISDSIRGNVSGKIWGVNYVASNLVTYSGVASGTISGEISGTISGVISGVISQSFSHAKEEIITLTDTYEMNIQGYSFLRSDINEEVDWSTTSEGVLKEKLLYLYTTCPTNKFIPVHVMEKELQLVLDQCRR